MHTLHSQNETDGQRQRTKMKQASALQVHCCDYIDTLRVLTVGLEVHCDAGRSGYCIETSRIRSRISDE